MDTDGKVNILLVDDRADTLLALRSVLDDPHQNIITARSGREALQHVLRKDFALILLDVNMPGMNGFETAELIRLRRSSRHTPIIFITGYSDEMHVTRGYSLGAVDFILAPVEPEILKTKVAVFVDLYEKTRQVKRQADSLRQYTQQLHELTEASLAINSAMSMERMLRVVADTARQLVGANHASAVFAVDQNWDRACTIVSLSERYTRPGYADADTYSRTISSSVLGESKSLRLTREELEEHAAWRGLSTDADRYPIPRGWLGVRLRGRGGEPMGFLEASDKRRGEFTEDDESILVQLAQMAAIAIENTLYSDARESNRLKDEFLATLSHELRTPLNAMLGWTRLLRTEDLDEAEHAHGLEVIERNVNAQSKLIEDLLDVSRINSGKLQMELSPIEPAPVIEAAAEAVRPAADAKSIRVEAAIDPATGRISGDPDRLRQVVSNLLSNALKFTPKEGRIRVALERAGGYVRIRVADTGEGIDPELLPHVVARFRQADSTSTRSHGGLGVGLAIVHHIVEQHGGAVHAESEGRGKGSTFIVKLPLHVADLDEPGPDADPRNNAPAAAQSLHGLRILLVDDEPDARELLDETLRRHGGRITAVASVQEALDAINRSTPDILISDIAMPEADGYDLIRIIRERSPEQGGGIPAIALTAYAAEEDRARCLAAGFHGHVAKPIEPAGLIAAIATLSAESLI